MVNKSPLHYFSLFLDEEILNLVTTETNRYAAQFLLTPLRPHSRLRNWENTDNKEMKLFLALIMWMGLAPLPTLAIYWGKKGIYTSNIPKYMKLKRFEILLRTFHFSNDEVCTKGSKYKSAFIPEEDLCIDESIIPFVGRLSFRQ